MVFRACWFWKKIAIYWYKGLDGKEGICLVKGIILGLYNNFSCAAGSCTSTCCSGWRIEVSNEAFLRFGNISNRVLREDILSQRVMAGAVCLIMMVFAVYRRTLVKGCFVIHAGSFQGLYQTIMACYGFLWQLHVL